jgi:hypothetical protein
MRRKTKKTETAKKYSNESILTRTISGEINSPFSNKSHYQNSPIAPSRDVRPVPRPSGKAGKVWRSGGTINFSIFVFTKVIHRNCLKIVFINTCEKCSYLLVSAFLLMLGACSFTYYLNYGWDS